MTRVRLLLRKDLTVLRRSPLLLGALIAYPIVIALLVGLVAGYASSKPRVAFVDEDGMPARRGRRRAPLPHPDGDRPGCQRGHARAHEPGRSSSRARLRQDRRLDHCSSRLPRSARHDRAEPQARPAHDERRPRAARDAADAGARLPAQPQAAGGIHRREPALREPDPARRQRELHRQAFRRAGSRQHGEGAERVTAKRARRADSQLHADRTPRTRADRQRAAGDRQPDRALAAEVEGAVVGALRAGAGVRHRAHRHLPLAAARRRRDRRGARRGTIGRLRRGLVSRGQLVWAKVALARPSGSFSARRSHSCSASSSKREA